MHLPIGYDNFREIIENKLDFVDKSLFIQEVLDDKSTKVAVITRPRRFGKTLNLSMLHHFLAPEVYGRSTEKLFYHLKIGGMVEEYKRHQGKYPVIFITFKSINHREHTTAYANLCKLISDVYSEHGYLLSSPQLSSQQKKSFELILAKEGSIADVATSLKDLTKYLSIHHGINPWILIDEYDTPLQASYLHNYYSEMIELMRSLLGNVLKTNPYLHKAIITGILRTAKESLFSGLNNLGVYTLLQQKYTQHFGFTELEVFALLKQAKLEAKANEIRDWYNGYQISDTVLYNPWSIVNCINNRGDLAPYWINTSDNQLIKDLLIKSSTDFKTQFELLLQGKSTERLIDENVVFNDLKSNETAVWSLLLMAGYLKPLSQRRTSDGLWCTLAIPNQEVRNLYQQIIKQWLANGHGIEWYNRFLNHLLSGNMAVFEVELREVMEQTISSHDTAKDPEAFYHGLIIGITASLSQSSHYEIQSNRESGYGRYDYMIFSRDKNKPTLLLEFKKVNAVKDAVKLTGLLIIAAKEALEQINQQGYLAEAKKRGSLHIIKIWLAFCGKRFKIQHERIKSKPSIMAPKL